MNRHADRRRPWLALVFALAHAAMFVPVSHAGAPLAAGASGQDAAPAGASGQDAAPAETPVQDAAPAGASVQDAAPAGASGQGAAPADTPVQDAAQTDATSAPPPRSYGLPRRLGWSWDLEVDLGLRVARRNADAALGMARVQAGVLRASEPWYFSFSATAELGGAADRGLGAQVTATHLYAGTWAHLGASWQAHDRVAVTSLGAGWSLFGVEWQRRLDPGDHGDALLLHLRVPLGTVWFLVTRRPVASPRP